MHFLVVVIIFEMKVYVVESPVNIAIFASGSGSNAENIIQYFQDKPYATVHLILSNNPSAGVLKRAKQYNVPTLTFTKEQLYDRSDVVDHLLSKNTHVVVLAGFLWLIPPSIIDKFAPYIVNIHPALLPKYGGKGMYGKHVHEAVLRNNESKSGITIHRVNENYDEGSILRQETCPVKPNDTPNSLAERIKKLEHRYYPEVIEELVQQYHTQH